MIKCLPFHFHELLYSIIKCQVVKVLQDILYKSVERTERKCPEGR